MNELPYKDIRILDISQGIAGPYCAHVLWQQGAHVIKVEPPSGDWGRFVGVAKGQHSALSTQFNAGKLGLALDARSALGQTILFDLAMQADVVVQNFRPGVVARLGIDYEKLAVKKPDLIYVSISGYGDDGPYADAPATDSVMQADSGLMFSNQDENGNPRRVGLLVADVATGLYASQALATALYTRLARGVGTHIKVNLFEACAAFQGMAFLEHAMAGKRPFGAVSAPNGIFKTQDGVLSVVTVGNEHFARLARALNRLDWLEDEHLKENSGRMVHRDMLHTYIREVLLTNTTEYWMQLFAAHEVLHACVRDYDDVLNHPQAKHLDTVDWIDQEGIGSLPYIGLPTQPYRRPAASAPAIGQHSVEVLSAAGFDSENIEQWQQLGIVFQHKN
jgi:crotonobetainyl-CoA:carnitine CoA-transferase CaiB-like acyl-CoA transferase